MVNAYSPPRVEIEQVFQPTLSANLPILAPFIFGPQKDFLDLSNEVDFAAAFAGEYDETIDNEYLVPKLNAAAVLDEATVEVVLDDLEAMYFEKFAGAGAYDYKVVTGFSNRIAPVLVAAGPNLKTFTNSAGTVFPRDAVFESRDVKVGDVAEVSAVIGLSLVLHKSKILSLLNEVIAATTGLAVADAGNTATVAGSVGPVTPDGGNTGDDVVAASGVYTGSLSDDVLTDTYVLEVITGGTSPVLGPAVADGGNTGDDAVPTVSGTFNSVVDDTYTIEVTLGGVSGVAAVTITSVEGDSSGPTVVTAATPFAVGTLGVFATFATFGGDLVLTLGDKWTVPALASAGRLSVTSASGTDDVPVIAFPGFGVAFAVGARGLLATITDGGDTLVTLGDKFSIPVVKAIGAVVATSSGTYVGTQDLTYTVEVVEGGLYGSARILATSTSVDSSGPLLVTAAATPVSVGTKGVLIAFAANTQGGLVKGDKWTVVVTSEKKGAVKTFVLQDSLPTLLITGSPALTTRLHLVQENKALPRFRLDIPSVEAWTPGTSLLLGEAIVTLDSALVITDPSWFDISGELPLPIRFARVYIGWEALRLENAGARFTISGPDYTTEIEARLGRISSKNPIALGFFLCSLNTIDRPIHGMTVLSDTPEGYQTVFDFIKELDDIYSLVPLTQDPLVHQALDAHVDQMSTPIEGRWRIGLINRALETFENLFLTWIDAEGDVRDFVATIIDDPTTGATDYRLLVADAGQGVNFISQGVVPGNVVRHSFRLDFNGKTVWTETAVLEVVSSTVLRLAENLDAAVTIASKFELFRNLDKTEQATRYGLIAESLKDRRLFLHYPDLVGRGGELLKGFYLCCATAGMKAALPPHQGFTNFQVQGFDDLSRAFIYFTRDQLNILGGSGVYIVTQETLAGTPFVRHQLSTDISATVFSEMSITTNVDSISYFFKDVLAPFIGIWNVVPDTLEAIRRSIEGGVDTLINQEFERIGAQLLSGVILRLEQNATFKDRVDVDLDIEVPFPLNVLTLRLIV